MASSFITKDNKHGFWIYDNLFQITCRLLCIVIEKNFITKSEDWVKKLHLLLDKNAKGFFHSYMHLDLDEFVINDFRKSFINQIIGITKEYIEDNGECITIDQLRSWHESGEIEYEWSSPIGKDRLKKILTFLGDVVNDKISIMVGDEINYDF